MDLFNEMKTIIKVKIKISRIRIMMRMWIRDALIKKENWVVFPKRRGSPFLGKIPFF